MNGDGDSSNTAATLASLRSEVDAIKSELRNCSCSCAVNTPSLSPQTSSRPTPPHAHQATQDADGPPAPLLSEEVDEIEPAQIQFLDSSVTSLDQEMENINPDDLLNWE